ncbi:MAG TPA: hypothetical protein VK798_13450 [Alloacidobacterium sp.]|jgi:hypothetical protein|nr:hypothetical protein [Alloacidobacterium sp.]
MRILRPICFALAMLLPLANLARADKLRNFYMGSGGYSAQVHRIVLLELATDGTAMLQQNWHGKPSETWHVHWTRNGRELVLNFDPVDGKATPTPATFRQKNNMLVPVTWDSQYLGILGPPNLMPFHGKNSPQGSLTRCEALDYRMPSGCVQWDSRDGRR